MNGDQASSVQRALAEANAYWQAGAADKAQRICHSILADWPDQGDAFYLLGIIAHAAGQLDLALAHLRKACLSPNAPASYVSDLAEICRQKGLLAEAEQAGRRATQLDPHLAAAWNNLGIILQESGKLSESAACLSRVIATAPDNAQAHNNLGNTLRRLEQMERARTHYEKALTLYPFYAEAHANLADLLESLGQHERAIAEASRAIELNPRLVLAYMCMARLEAARRNPQQALDWLSRLATFTPLPLDALILRMKALRDCSLFDAALEAAQEIVLALPQNGEAYNALAEILHALDRTHEAVAVLDKAMALPAVERARLAVNRGMLLGLLDDSAAARQAFEDVLNADPSNIPAFYNLAELQTFETPNPYLLQMEQLAQSDRVHHQADRISLHFALGKAYLDAGQSDQAFHHFHLGNKAKRSTINFNASATAGWMRDIVDAFSSARLPAMEKAGPASDQPVFIVGMPRSGTTLMEQMLASHPQVYGAGELPILANLATQLGDYPFGAKALSSNDYAALGERYLTAISPLAKKGKHVVDKMPTNFLHIGLIRLILPNARIIHCRRDPVDTCLSCYTKLFNGDQNFAYDLTELGLFYRAYEAMMADWKRVAPSNRLLTVDYEAVVEDPEAQVRHLLDFLGLAWDDACLSFYDNPRVVRTASFHQVRQPIYKSAKGRWKAHVRHLQPLLDALGIEPIAMRSRASLMSHVGDSATSFRKP